MLDFFIRLDLTARLFVQQLVSSWGQGRDCCSHIKGKKMKKTLFVLFGLAVLTGCSTYYDYYKGGVRYTQDGDDCVFYSAERGRRYSGDIRSLDTDKKIVYRNTQCRDLYLRDNFGQLQRTERQVLTPVVKKDCGCAKKCSKKKYVFVK